MNRAANALAEAIRRQHPGARKVCVCFDYTFVEIGGVAVRSQNSAKIRRVLSAGDPEIGEFTFLAVPEGSSEIDWGAEVLNDNIYPEPARKTKKRPRRKRKGS